MIILGIDPGTTSIGYALLTERVRRQPLLLTSGLITAQSQDTASRLVTISKTIQKLVRDWKVTLVAIERLFFAKNTKTAMAVSESRGAILLTCALEGLRVYEYTPLEAKFTITGDGKADKNQIKKMIRLTLRETKTLSARDDVFDAIALALTCYFKERIHFQRS